MMDLDKVSKSLEKFISKHKSQFYEIPKRETALFEIVGIVATSEKLKKVGFKISTNNLVSNKFRVKTSSSGNPHNFSHFLCKKGSVSLEIHGNLMVVGAHGVGTYCVDVGVIFVGGIPAVIGNVRKWKGVENKYLFSFAEMKKMVAFPMLLAQFIGIVHEIMPRFIMPRMNGSARKSTMRPSLMVQRYSSPNCKAIVDEFPKRGIAIDVEPEAAAMLWTKAFDDEI